MLHNYNLFGLITCSELIMAKEEKNNYCWGKPDAFFGWLCALFLIAMHFVIAIGNKEEENTNNQ